MALVNSKEVLQSYIITSAKYDFSVYEKRILYRQIEIEQELLLGQKIRPGVRIDTTLFGDKYYTIPVNWLLPNGEQDKNHHQVKKAFESLMKKIITYEDENFIMGFPLIKEFKIDKKGETVRWQCHPMIVDVIVNFSKGFRKYELKTAIEFNSVYAMRFYELLSGQEKPLTFTIDQLKAMFKLENKYTRINDFIKYVIDPAKKELDKKSPYSFDFKINKQGKKFHSITFYPVKIQENQDPELEKQKVLKEVSLHWSLDRGTINYLKEVFFFDTKELKQHQELFENAHKLMDLILFLSERKRYILEAKNPKGYLISCLKKEVERFFFETDNQSTEMQQYNNDITTTQQQSFKNIKNLISTLTKKKSVKE